MPKCRSDTVFYRFSALHDIIMSRVFRKTSHISGKKPIGAFFEKFGITWIPTLNRNYRNNTTGGISAARFDVCTVICRSF